MTISTIVSVAPDGEAFSSKFGGALQPFKYEFEDGTSGVANHKAEAGARFKAGDSVEYTVTGDFKGVAKLKVSLPDTSFSGKAPSSSSNWKSSPKSSKGGFDQVGIEVGAAFNVASRLAAALITSGQADGNIIEMTSDIAKKVLAASSALKDEISSKVEAAVELPVSTPSKAAQTAKVDSPGVATIAPTPISSADTKVSLY